MNSKNEIQKIHNQDQAQTDENPWTPDNQKNYDEEIPRFNTVLERGIKSILVQMSYDCNFQDIMLWFIDVTRQALTAESYSAIYTILNALSPKARENLFKFCPSLKERCKEYEKSLNKNTEPQD